MRVPGSIGLALLGASLACGTDAGDALPRADLVLLGGVVYTLDEPSCAEILPAIEVGKAADLVVLERNLFELPAEEIGEVRGLQTFFEGERVYAAHR